MASDASIEMPGDESSTSGGETRTAANGLSNVVEYDARILEVKERELFFKRRIEVGEEEFAEKRRQMDIRSRIEDEEDGFAEARRQLERRRRDEEN